MRQSGILEWLRGLHRGYKFAVVLIAAWAPFAFPDRPLLTGILMALMVTVFFVTTGPGESLPKAELRNGREHGDVET